MGTLRVLVADDHEIVRQRLAEYFGKRQPGWEVAGEALRRPRRPWIKRETLKTRRYGSRC